MKKTIIQIICCLLVVALAFGISWLIGKGIPPNADAGPPTQIEHTHSFDDWQTTKEATCAETGTETRTCECGYFEERELAALGHDYVDGKCSRCGEVDPEYVPPCGHSSERKEITLEATCTEPGKAKIYCEECGELLREETIPAKGHGILSETITAATCTQKGIDRHYCIYCNEKFETYETSALGHKYVNGTCSRCGATDSTTYRLKVSSSKRGIYFSHEYDSYINWTFSTQVEDLAIKTFSNVFDKSKTNYLSVEIALYHGNSFMNSKQRDWAFDTNTLTNEWYGMHRIDSGLYSASSTNPFIAGDKYSFEIIIRSSKSSEVLKTNRYTFTYEGDSLGKQYVFAIGVA